MSALGRFRAAWERNAAAIIGESTSAKKRILEALMEEVPESDEHGWPEGGNIDDILMGVADGTYPMAPESSEDDDDNVGKGGASSVKKVPPLERAGGGGEHR